MMAPALSLKRTYQRYGLLFLLITLAINSIIPLCMMCTGMFSMHEVTMGNAAQAARQLQQQGVDTLITDNMQVVDSWQQLPDAIRELWDNQPPSQPGEILTQHANGKFIDAVMLYRQDNRDSYVWLRYNATHDLVFAPKNMTAILLLIIMTFMVTASLAYSMEKRVIRPVRQISEAIKRHDWQNMSPLKLPKQGYAELQSIVAALESSIDKLLQVQQREMEFLRFTSHELRTPIAICQSSFDLMTLQQGQLSGPALTASRATKQMRSITETLLWMMRPDYSVMEPTVIPIKQCLEEVVQEQLAAQGSHIKITVEGDNCQLLLLKEPLLIVLNNLIRNSIEHGSEQVFIRQRGGTIEVSNDCGNDNHSGFGLGLMLVNRLTKQLQWEFTTRNHLGQFSAQLKVG